VSSAITRATTGLPTVRNGWTRNELLRAAAVVEQLAARLRAELEDA
jgi:hypothetical protein